VRSFKASYIFTNIISLCSGGLAIKAIYDFFILDGFNQFSIVTADVVTLAIFLIVLVKCHKTVAWYDKQEHGGQGWFKGGTTDS
jgi:hypothetical protein